MIHIDHLNVSYGKRTLFHDAEITIERGQLTAICGPSGVGKTTLLNIIGLISGFSDYTYTFDENVIDVKNEQWKADMRKQNIAYVFQEHNLHDDLSIMDNIKLYCYISGHKFNQEQANAVLSMMGLTMNADTLVSVLSGGEYQRLSLACALMKNPHVVIADEVTSALDDKNREYIIRLLKDIAQSGRMVILATHDKDVLTKCDVVYTLSAQKIIKERCNSELPKVQNDKQRHYERINTLDLATTMHIFYHWYSKFSLGKRRWEKRTFIILPSIIIFLCLFFIGIKDGMVQHFHDSLNAYGMNEVYITGNYDISDSALASLKAIDGVGDAVSFSLSSIDSIQVDDKTLDLMQSATVAPYFSFQNEYLKNEQTQDAFLSYYLAERYHIKPGSMLHIKEGDMEINVKIGAILEQDVQLVQGMSSLFVIYVPHNIYSGIGKTQAVIHLESFEAFNHITDDIEKLLPNHQAYLAQSDYLTQMASLDTYSQYLETFIAVLLVLTILFLSISQYFAVKNRKYEICVLRANGLSKKETARVIFHIFANDMIKTGSIVLILLLGAKFIAVLTGSEIFALTGYMFIFYLLMVIGTYVIPVGLTLWIMLRIDIEKMMRT